MDEVLPNLRQASRYVTLGAAAGYGEPTQDIEYHRHLDTVSEARRLYDSLGLAKVPELPRDPRAKPLAIASAQGHGPA